MSSVSGPQPPTENTLQVKAIKTEIFNLGQNLETFILQHVAGELKERTVLAVTSKIVSLAEGRVLKKDSIGKQELIQQEAEHDLGEIGYGCYLTIAHRLFMASAGIDESNSVDGDYILLPKDPFLSAQKLHQSICQSLGIKELGIIITDSKTQPLRRGVTGVALAYWGFKGLHDKVGETDLFGRELKMTTINCADALATSTTFLMGEGSDCCPLAIAENAPVVFCSETDPDEIGMPVDSDMYYPLYKHLL